MGGDEQELHAADEVGRGHHQEGRASEGARQRGLGRLPVQLGGACRQGQAIDAAGDPGGRQHAERQHQEAQHAGTPAEVDGQPLPQRRRQQRAQRARRGDGAQHQAAPVAGHGARADGERNGRGGAGERQADQHARAQHHAQHALGQGEGEHARQVEDAAAQHHRPEADADGKRARHRLQEAPGQVLHRHGEREVGDADGDVAGERRHDQPEALADAAAQAQHDRRPDQDRQGRAQLLDEAHGSPLLTQVCVP